MKSAILVVQLMLLAAFIAAGAVAVDRNNASAVCQTDGCWRMSMALQSSLNASTDPCVNFEEFLCGGFRSREHFKGDSLLRSGIVHLDYLGRNGLAYSDRVTEQLATSCWEANCSASEDPGRPSSTRLSAYEHFAVRALKDCASVEASDNGWSFHHLLRASGGEILDEVADLAVKGLDLNSPQQMRFERLMPAQSAKSLMSPLVALPGLARRNGQPALLLHAGETFYGFDFAWPLFRTLPYQDMRLARLLHLPAPRGGIARLARLVRSDLLLWSESCNRTADVVLSLDASPVQTVGDAKRLLRLANLTFQLDEFLQQSLRLTEGHAPVTDSTPLVLPDRRSFIRVVCMLERCRRRFTELPKLLVLNQVCLLGMAIFTTPTNTKCIDAFFGRPDSSSSASIISHEGAFRPLLHGRYSRARSAEIQAVKAETIETFDRVKTAYSEALEAHGWISAQEKLVLKQRLQRTQLKFLTDQVSEAALLTHFDSVFDSLTVRGCSISGSPACILVRAFALREYLVMRTLQATFDQASPHYDPNQEAVILPAAFLDYPHFLPNQPRSVRFGVQAFVLAHELTHGVLDDSYGGFVGANFAEQLGQRRNCLKQRLARRLGLNKTNIDEDVADAVGLSVALRLLGETGGDRIKRLPGFLERYSSEQLVYMTSLRIFCTKSGPNFHRYFFESGSQTWSHTPGLLRIRGLLNGDDHFRRVFGCSASSDAVSAAATGERCEFW